MLSLEFAELYEPLFNTNARYIDLWGGRGRGGSFTGTQYFLHLITQPEYFRGYLMREIAGDVRESLWRDFKDRIDEADLLDQFTINETAMSAVYNPTGNILLSKGFKKSSGNRTAKLKSLAGATHVLIEEAEEIAKFDFNQLDDSLRTNKVEHIQIIRIFNPPPKNHWFWEKYNLVPCDNPKEYYRAIPKKDPSLLSIFSTYYDNIANINESSVVSYEGYKETDPEYYYTIIQGLISEGVRGRIYKDFKLCDEMPNEYPKFYGLDWGFNDPVALLECEAHNKTLWVDEKVYKPGLLNSELSQLMKDMGISKTAPIYADSAEPKDIKELKQMGWNVIAAQKGADSVRNGIKFIKEFQVNVTEKSRNLWKESEEYHWRLDQYKMPTNEPEDKNNHCFTGDTPIFTEKGIKQIKDIQVNDLVATSKGYKKVLIKHSNGLRQVNKYLMHFDTFSLSLFCTKDHLIKTDSGWTQIQKLQSGQTVYLHSNLMGNIITYTPKKDIFQKEIDECIGMFGFSLMGKLIRDFKYTIKTVIHGITRLIILNLKKPINIFQTIAKKDIQTIKNGQLNFKEKESQKHLSGIDQKKEGTGTLNMEEIHGLTDLTKNASVKNAEMNIKQGMAVHPNFAIKTAKLNHLEKGISWKEEVYDLTIEDQHEYFANGVLVHNCMDALRYAMDKVKKPMGLRIVK